MGNPDPQGKSMEIPDNCRQAVYFAENFRNFQVKRECSEASSNGDGQKGRIVGCLQKDLPLAPG